MSHDLLVNAEQLIMRTKLYYDASNRDEAMQPGIIPFGHLETLVHAKPDSNPEWGWIFAPLIKSLLQWRAHWVALGYRKVLDPEGVLTWQYYLPPDLDVKTFYRLRSLFSVIANSEDQPTDDTAERFPSLLLSFGLLKHLLADYSRIAVGNEAASYKRSLQFSSPLLLHFGDASALPLSWRAQGSDVIPAIVLPLMEPFSKALESAIHLNDFFVNAASAEPRSGQAHTGDSSSIIPFLPRETASLKAWTGAVEDTLQQARDLLLRWNPPADSNEQAVRFYARLKALFVANDAALATRFVHYLLLMANASTRSNGHPTHLLSMPHWTPKEHDTNEAALAAPLSLDQEAVELLPFIATSFRGASLVMTVHSKQKKIDMQNEDRWLARTEKLRSFVPAVIKRSLNSISGNDHFWKDEYATNPGASVLWTWLTDSTNKNRLENELGFRFPPCKFSHDRIKRYLKIEESPGVPSLIGSMLEAPRFANELNEGQSFILKVTVNGKSIQEISGLMDVTDDEGIFTGKINDKNWTVRDEHFLAAACVGLGGGKDITLDILAFGRLNKVLVLGRGVPRKLPIDYFKRKCASDDRVVGDLEGYVGALATKGIVIYWRKSPLIYGRELDEPPAPLPSLDKAMAEQLLKECQHSWYWAARTNDSVAFQLVLRT